MSLMPGKKPGTAETVRANQKAERKSRRLRRKAPTEQDRRDRFLLVSRCLSVVRWGVQAMFAATLTAVLATTAVPVSIAALSNVLGVGYNSVGLDVVFLFGMPSLFLTACWTAFDIWAVRSAGRRLKAFTDGIAGRFDPAGRSADGNE